MRRLLISFFLIAIALPAQAQDRRPSHCIAIADAAPGIEYLHKASWHTAPDDEFTVRLTYVDHSMYLIQTAGGSQRDHRLCGFRWSYHDDPRRRDHEQRPFQPLDPCAPTLTSRMSFLAGDRTVNRQSHYLDLGEMLIRNVNN